MFHFFNMLDIVAVTDLYKMFKTSSTVTKLKVVWAAFALIAVSAVSLLTHAPFLVFLSTIIGIVFVVGAAYEWKYANLFGAALALMFAMFSYDAGFYGNMAVNLFIIAPASVYGFYVWKNRDASESRVSRSIPKRYVTPFSLASLMLFGLCYAFSFAAGSTLMVLDAMTTALPIIATMLMIHAYKQHWYFWITFNTIQVYMWFTVAATSPEMLALLAMKSVFLANSIIGYVLWHKEIK